MRKMIFLESSVKEMADKYHYPVMYREVLELLNVGTKKVVVDCTVGIGSHAHKLLGVMRPDCFYIGIDKDQDSLDIASNKLRGLKRNFTLVKEDFSNLDKVLKNLGIEGADAFLFDLGISSYQLSDPHRGFSFLKEGPLDMRMDRNSFLSAYDLINNLSEGELVNIFRKFGEERYSKRIANSLIKARKNKPVSTTTQLAQIIKSSIPVKYQYSRINPATRVFQSLRITVNRELESLSKGITKAVSLLNMGGRIGVISFHSLEDRIVKHKFREYSAQGFLNIITKKPLQPLDLEVGENPPSRSAKFRVAERKQL